MKILMYIYSLFLFVSCQGQTTEKKTLSCGNSSIEIELPNINKVQEQQFSEGKATLLTTKDSVIIEFYCGGNYSSHISDKERYKVLSKKSNSSIGIDLKTNLYWRKDGKLIYSNCKVNDTAFYNKIFNNKIVKK